MIFTLFLAFGLGLGLAVRRPVSGAIAAGFLGLVIMGVMRG